MQPLRTHALAVFWEYPMSLRNLNQPRFGFIGLGDMGAALAMRMLKVGLPLSVCDKNVLLADPFLKRGACLAHSPKELASQAEIVFSCLPSPHISEDVAFGQHGVIHGDAIKVYVEMSTIGAECMMGIAAQLQKKGVGVIDAPVSGGPAGAASGNMTCMVAAADSDVDYARMALSALSDQLFHIGKLPGQAQVMKLANNALTATNLAVASEMIHMARLAGIDPETAVQVLNASSGRNRATEVTFPQQILNGRFSIGAKISILHKDVGLALAEAQRLGAEHNGVRGIHEVWNNAMEAGRGAQDMSMLHEHIGAASK